VKYDVYTECRMPLASRRIVEARHPGRKYESLVRPSQNLPIFVLVGKSRADQAENSPSSGSICEVCPAALGLAFGASAFRSGGQTIASISAGGPPDDGWPVRGVDNPPAGEVGEHPSGVRRRTSIRPAQ